MLNLARGKGIRGYHNSMASLANQVVWMIVVVITFIPYCIGFALLYPIYYVLRAVWRIAHHRKADIKPAKLLMLAVAAIFAIGTITGIAHAVSDISHQKQIESPMPAKKTKQPVGYKYHNCHQVVNWHSGGTTQTVCSGSTNPTSSTTTGNPASSVRFPNNSATGG